MRTAAKPARITQRPAATATANSRRGSGRSASESRQEHHGRAEDGQLGQKGQPGVHGNPLMNGTEAVLMTSKRIAGKSPNSTITAARIMRGTPSRNGMSFRCANFSLAGP